MPEQGRVSDNAHCGADAHGCPACPHAVTGPGVSGSPNVFVNALPALRVGDPGIHAACCGPNTWEAVEGAPSVFMNGKKAHRKGDGTKHCGGDGELVVGSPNVFVGNQQPKEREIEKSWFKLRVVNHRGDPVPNLKVRVHLPTGPQELTTDGSGRIQVKDVDPGSVFVEFLATMPIERMYRGVTMVDTRLVKQPLPQCTPQAMCMTGAETTVVVPPPHYYDARNDDPAPAHKASNMVWAVDPTTNQAVSEVGNVDLERGAKDDNTLFDWVSDLQHDLWDFGYRAHLANKGTGAIPASFEATGEFDDRLERVVRRFQIHATLNTRKTRGGGPMSVPSQFKGEVNGIVDDETKREIARWVAAGYVRVLQPFDPERILSTQFAAGHINPEFYTLLTETLVARADEQDLELYGATTRSADPDGFREHHPYSTWHLVGLGCDLNSYSTKVVGAPWYDPRGEYDAWPIWEWERYRTMVKAVGLLISFPPSKDPRHVEFHPLVVHPDDPTRWTSVPRSIRDFISNSGPNSNANIRRAWGIAVNTRYAASELAPLTSPRPRPRPARPSGD